MSQPTIYLDRSEIRAGNLEDVRSRIARLSEFIEEREPQLLMYGFYFAGDGSEMTVLAIHPDAASLELHLEVGREAFREFSGLLDLRSIEVFGAVSEHALRLMREKAEYLGGAPVLVAELEDGFSRVSNLSLR